MKGRRARIVGGVVGACAAIAIYFLFLASWTPAQHAGVAAVIGVGTHGNLSSEAFALGSGVRFFRNDITLSASQVSHIGNESSAYGAQYLGILDYETVQGENWTLGEWNATVANAVRGYPEIKTWEVWNQPWYPPFQTGLVNGSAYNYYLVTKAAYAAIKAAEPNATVVCFGGAPIADYDTFLWYEQAWGYGMARYCDAISIHAYPSLPFNQTEQDAWSSYLSAYENMTGKPIWITETGIPVVQGQISGADQASFLHEDISFLSGFSYVKRVYWYDLWGLSGQYDYGLLNLSDPGYGTPKPAWGEFMSLYNESASVG